MFIRNSRNKPLPHGRRGELPETTDHHLKNSCHEALNMYHCHHYCHPVMVLLSLLSPCCFSIRGVVLPLAVLFSFLLWCCSHYFRRVAFPFVLFSHSRCCSHSCRCIFLLRFVVFFSFVVLLPLLIEISF